MASANTVSLTVVAGDTYPPWPLAVEQFGKWLDLSDAETITLNGRGQTTATAITGTCDPVTPSTITADLITNDLTLTDVSDFTDILVGTTLLGEGIADMTQVADFDSIAGTILMSNPATSDGSSTTITVGQGAFTLTPTDQTATPDTYMASVLVQWTDSGQQTFPNDPANNLVIVVAPAINPS